MESSGLYATLAGAGLTHLLSGGDTRSSGFVRRMMAENMVKHKGKYGKPTSPHDPNTSMNANRPFEFKKMATPSKFIKLHFGEDATGVHAIKRKGNKPPPYTEPFKKTKDGQAPQVIERVVEKIVYRDRPVNRPALNTLTQRELGTLWKEYGLSSYSTKTKDQLVEGLQTKTNYPEPGLKGKTPAVAAPAPVVNEPPRLVIREAAPQPNPEEVITHVEEAPRNTVHYEPLSPVLTHQEEVVEEKEDEVSEKTGKLKAPVAAAIPEPKLTSYEKKKLKKAKEDKEARDALIKERTEAAEAKLTEPLKKKVIAFAKKYPGITPQHVASKFSHAYMERVKFRKNPSKAPPEKDYLTDDDIRSQGLGEPYMADVYNHNDFHKSATAKVEKNIEDFLTFYKEDYIGGVPSDHYKLDESQKNKKPSEILTQTLEYAVYHAKRRKTETAMQGDRYSYDYLKRLLTPAKGSSMIPSILEEVKWNAYLGSLPEDETSFTYSKYADLRYDEPLIIYLLKTKYAKDIGE